MACPRSEPLMTPTRPWNTGSQWKWNADLINAKTTETPLTESPRGLKRSVHVHKIPRGGTSHLPHCDSQGDEGRDALNTTFSYIPFPIVLRNFQIAFGACLVAWWRWCGGLFISLTSIPYLPRTQIFPWIAILLDLCLGEETPYTGLSLRVLKGKPRNLLSRWGEPLLRALCRALGTVTGSLWIVSYGEQCGEEMANT